MYWFIRFHNEPEHPYHHTMIDFGTLIQIIRGDIQSQMPQMSKIHKMMVRYSVKKATRFLSRFPQVYWAPEANIQTPMLYYFTTVTPHKYINEEHILSWWNLNSQSSVVFMSSATDHDNQVKVLNTGEEFYLYHDPGAGFNELQWIFLKEELPKHGMSENNKVNKEKHSRNSQLRQQLGMRYNWRQEAHPYQVPWIRQFLSSCCNEDYFIHFIYHTQYDIRKENREIGMIAIMEYRVYLTLWTDEDAIPQIFGMTIEELITTAQKENIEFYYTNSL